MSFDDTLYIHCLGKASGVGAEKIRLLRVHFRTAEAAWHGSRSDFLAAGFSDRLADALVTVQKKVFPEQEQVLLDRHGICLVGRSDDDYPELLSEIPNPPELLYFRGDARPNRQPLITIVGTRRPTEYGIGVAREFARELGRSGFGVVSGMAFGIDREAHLGALDAKATTLAVLGNGLDDTSLSPRAHLDIARSIIRCGGALVSDYPPLTSASVGTFPARNRIMAGMTLGTIVIEATAKSGTLITANLALEYNREVFAVPGSVHSEYSRGPHELIRHGATLVGSLADILDNLPVTAQHTSSSTPKPAAGETNDVPAELSKDEMLLLKKLGSDTLHIDKLVKLSTLKTSDALSTLSLLEMKGLVKNVGNMHYIRTYTVR